MAELAQVAEIIAQEIDIPANDIKPETTLEQLGVDSLEFMDLLLTIEEKCGQVPSQRIAHINTVGDLLAELP